MKTKEQSLKEILISYGEALLALPDYEKRYKKYPMSHPLYVTYKEQLDWVNQLELVVKSIATNLAKENERQKIKTK